MNIQVSEDPSPQRIAGVRKVGRDCKYSRNKNVPIHKFLISAAQRFATSKSRRGLGQLLPEKLSFKITSCLLDQRFIHCLHITSYHIISHPTSNKMYQKHCTCINSNILHQIVHDYKKSNITNTEAEPTSRWEFSDGVGTLFHFLGQLTGIDFPQSQQRAESTTTTAR